MKTDDLAQYGLDMHGTMILEDYRACLPVFERMKGIVLEAIRRELDENGIVVTTLEARVKTEASLAGKLERKGVKYSNIKDLTDLVGCRVVTFYSDEVDKIAALADKLFEIDWANSVDKRRMHDLDSFGYSSLHYICRIPESVFCDPACPEINQFRFELQMRTALQHVWATLDHDTGYKSGIEIPRAYLRNLNRLAGILELVDEQFSRLRTEINDYRRHVQSLVANGRFEEVSLDGDSFRSFLEIKPFDDLIRRIAAINQAEVHQASLAPFYKVFRLMGFDTLGDVLNLVKRYSDDAYHLSLKQLGGTDLDIISSSLAVLNLCIVYLLENGAGASGLVRFYETLDGPSAYNQVRAERMLETAAQLPFMNRPPQKHE